ncbi:MGMT family protein [uncultured Arthrobacter sp.]|uniref:MGMT family protein n=1 Tax=uncultured Arthrobacter sp. TaxID=114050 RepID=UPI00262B72CF|nr:MGMT family protein [uncultured Arthrobacter sp.]
MRERALDYEEAVLDIVSLIPAGRVLTYGDIAEILEKGGPRQVGTVMSRGDAGVPWWRVLRADGSPPQGLEASAVEHYLEESTALRPVANRSRRADARTRRVDLSKSRWDPAPAEQCALQQVRAALKNDVRIGASGLSEADDGVDP